MIIKHKNFLDTAIQVNRRYGNKIYGEWLNMGFVETYRIDIKFKKEITNWNDWLRCKEPWAKCIRYAQWEPMNKGG